ncbi:MAG TPA: ribosome maturation factor RimM [Candidatus Saccharimonadia bacterium]|nr:ribosome maturation factor RimM [Candidatus Saccharimonadia bacterium]
MTDGRAGEPGRVLLGKVVGVFGVEGWVKVHSYTEPRENLFRYKPWIVRSASGDRTVEKPTGRVQGQGIVAQLPEVADRDAAAALIGAEILVDRSTLPQPKQGEYYWSDLEGLEVKLEDGTLLGTVSHLFSTGANDVLVVRGTRERLLPYLPGDVVKKIDLERRVIEVDWDPEF